MIRINLGHRLLGLNEGGSGPPVTVDSFVPWHIVAGETITVPTRRQMHLHGALWNQGSLILKGSAQLVVKN
jgi:hypothetical protein